MRKKGENSVKSAGKSAIPPDEMMISPPAAKVNPSRPAEPLYMFVPGVYKIDQFGKPAVCILALFPKPERSHGLVAKTPTIWTSRPQRFAVLHVLTLRAELTRVRSFLLVVKKKSTGIRQRKPVEKPDR
jgi:hypothetical protein